MPEQRSDDFSTRTYLGIFLSVLTALLIQVSGLFPFIPALALSFWLYSFLQYWLSPKPAVSLITWLWKISAAPALLIIGLWTTPKLLSRLISPALAYGIPTFTTVLLVYWVPKVFPAKKRRSFIEWVILSAGVALTVAAAAYHSQKSSW